jgi:CDP-glycerol glycerophosphotransferase (TagB/SpsB family)
MVDPIIKYLPLGSYLKSENYKEDLINVCFFVDSRHIPHKGIFMSHGIADKNWRDGNRVSTYNYVCVSGELWKQKMLKEGILEEKILVIGYTKLDSLFNNLQKKKGNDNKIHVLYAPTHNTGLILNPEAWSFSCFPRLNKYLFQAPEDMIIMDSLHPANDLEGKTTFDLYNWADVVISDCGSTLYEAWALNIPVVFPDWLVKEPISRGYKNSFENLIYNQNIGYHAINDKQFWDVIRYAKIKGLNRQTEDFIEGIFPKRLRGNSGRTMAEYLIKIAGD